MTPEERSDRLLVLVERVVVALEKIAGGCAPLKPPGKAEPSAASHAKDYPLDPDKKWRPIPVCPKCGEPMLLRTAKSSGKQFWGCRKFPDCDGARGEDGQAWEGKGRSSGRRSRIAGPGSGPQGEAAQDAYERDLAAEHDDDGEAF